jgi:putative membrane protein
VISTLTAGIATAGLATSGIATHAGGPWAGGFGWFFLLIPLFWIALFAVLFAVARRARWAGGGHPGWAQPTRSAESSLAERFAQGDIDEKDYRARLEVLRANAYPERPRK